MLSGIQLTLLIGPAVPIPAPKSVMDALQSIQVTSGKDKSGFQIAFSVSKQSILQTTLLPAGYFDPMITRVIIIVTVNGFPNVLMDGIVTRQEVSPSNQAAESKLTITGEDLSVLMDVVEIKMPYPCGSGGRPDLSRTRCRSRCSGLLPLMIPPIIPVIKNPLEDWDTQTGTHLSFIRDIAERNGYVFYVDPGPLPGQSVAYFGPDINLPIPQHALNVNMDAHTNVESLSFSLDGLAKKVRIYTIMDPIHAQDSNPDSSAQRQSFQTAFGSTPDAARQN